MSEVKKRLTYEEQVEKLRARGCVINDDIACKNVLKNIGYYRLSAYFLPFGISERLGSTTERMMQKELRVGVPFYLLLSSAWAFI